MKAQTKKGRKTQSGLFWLCTCRSRYSREDLTRKSSKAFTSRWKKSCTPHCLGLLGYRKARTRRCPSRSPQASLRQLAVGCSILFEGDLVFSDTVDGSSPTGKALLLLVTVCVPLIVSLPACCCPDQCMRICEFLSANGFWMFLASADFFPR